jgi:conjugal transfer/type IV secretion protein DotA/TraY
MQSYEKDYPAVNATYVTPPAPEYPIGANKIVYDFVAYKQTGTDSTGTPTSTKVSCGQILIDNAPASSFIVQGLNAIMPSLNSAAYFMVNDAPVITSPNTTEEQQAMQDTFNFVGSDFMNEVATTYNSYVIQANNANTTPSENDYYEDIRSYGWVTLGNLYWDMAKSNGEGGNDATQSAKLKWNTNSQNIADTVKWGENYTATAIKYGNTYANQFIADLKASRDADNNGSGSFASAETNDFSSAASGFISHITLTTLNSLQVKLDDGANPMIAAQKIGHEISYDVEATLAALMVAVSASAFVAGVWSSVNSYYLVYQIVVGMALPGLLIFAGLMLVLGGTLAVVIPFIPAMAYFLAIVAWMVATLETMVAAPIVAIGVIHPEGHAVWGKAEPAIMLMTNMFLRPSLIVIGMAAGVILSFITVQFVNFGFSQAMGALLTTNKMPSSMEATLFLTTYVALILACVNKSFSTIDAIPEQVMRWIQGGEATKFGGGQESMQKLQGAQESSGQKAGGDAMSSGQEASQATDKGITKMSKNEETGAQQEAGNKAVHAGIAKKISGN